MQAQIAQVLKSMQQNNGWGNYLDHPRELIVEMFKQRFVKFVPSDVDGQNIKITRNGKQFLKNQK